MHAVSVKPAICLTLQHISTIYNIEMFFYVYIVMPTPFTLSLLNTTFNKSVKSSNAVKEQFRYFEH